LLSLQWAYIQMPNEMWMEEIIHKWHEIPSKTAYMIRMKNHLDLVTAIGHHKNLLIAWNQFKFGLFLPTFIFKSFGCQVSKQAVRRPATVTLFWQNTIKTHISTQLPRTLIPEPKRQAEDLESVQPLSLSGLPGQPGWQVREQQDLDD
jgi:hypothetical protein